MKNLLILIPSYKRPEVLRATLGGLLEYTNQSIDYSVHIGVGLNKATPVEDTIVEEYKGAFDKKQIPVYSISYEDNIGKASILNALFSLYAKDSDLVVTMDNDMVILKPWLQYIDQSTLLDFDIMGFSSARFWAHDPQRIDCPFFDKNGFRYYSPVGVAGGMMLFHRKFLEEHPWTNYSGVYGRDDATMCLLTNKKYVLHTDEDWLVHDPLNSSTPILKDYENKKRNLYTKGITVFPVGWDE